VVRDAIAGGRLNGHEDLCRRWRSAEHHLFVAYKVTNVGNDTAHLASMAGKTKEALQAENLDAELVRTAYTLAPTTIN
jgi:hypothetical protein